MTMKYRWVLVDSRSNFCMFVPDTGYQNQGSPHKLHIHLGSWKPIICHDHGAWRVHGSRSRSWLMMMVMVTSDNDHIYEYECMYVDIDVI